MYYSEDSISYRDSSSRTETVLLTLREDEILSVWDEEECDHETNHKQPLDAPETVQRYGDRKGGWERGGRKGGWVREHNLSVSPILDVGARVFATEHTQHQ